MVAMISSAALAGFPPLRGSDRVSFGEVSTKTWLRCPSAEFRCLITAVLLGLQRRSRPREASGLASSSPTFTSVGRPDREERIIIAFVLEPIEEGVQIRLVGVRLFVICARVVTGRAGVDGGCLFEHGGVPHR